MGYIADREQFSDFIDKLKEAYEIWAPKKFKGGGRFSDTDAVRYAVIESPDEIELNEKSAYSWKEAVLPPSETLFYFAENHAGETEGPAKKKLVFLRSCDLAAVKRMDQIYMKNGDSDYYYERRRKDMAFALIGCSESCENGFCVAMQSNLSDNYDFSVDAVDGQFRIDCKNDAMDAALKATGANQAAVEPLRVTANKVTVNIPENLSYKVGMSSMWDQYDSRCINCGRCNFVCPTCTCYTMQDIFYTDNGKVGERRRVGSSCMVDGYTNVAGGGQYRRKHGERMRFKVLHKINDFKQKFGYNMCVGCGRCDDVCPEYISYANIVSKVTDAVEGKEEK